MTIVLCGGGSGGHITPLVAVASELKKQHKDIKLVYIGEKGSKFSDITESSKLFDELHYISAGKLRRYHGESPITRLLDVKTNVLNFIDIFKLAVGTIQAYFLLKKLKPDAALLKGGFVCVPIAIGAKMTNTPYGTHDSDALPGLSNRIAARWAKFHATALPAKYYSYPQQKIKVVGVPTDSRYRDYSESEINLLKEKYGFSRDNRVILITGGSNGARRLNAAVIKALPTLVENFPNIRFIHQLGKGNEDQITDLSANLKEKCYFFDFSNEFFHMSAVSELIITRAGASTMSDFANQAKACIMIPNPYLTGGHQLKNAEVFENAKAAVVINEAEMDEKLAETIKKLLDDREYRQQLGQNLKQLLPKQNAALALANLVVEIAQR